jgi:hypothetical protein
MGLGDKAKRAISTASGAVSVASGLYSLAVSVEGRPIRDKLSPSKVRILGIPLFERNANLERYWLGFIPRGRSKAAKEAIARAEAREREE